MTNLKILKSGDKIQKGDYYLNARSEYQLSRLVGLSIKVAEVGRYYRPFLVFPPIPTIPETEFDKTDDN